MKRLWYVSVLLVTLLLASCGGVVIVGGPSEPTPEIPYVYADNGDSTVESGESVVYTENNTRNIEEIHLELENVQQFTTRYEITGSCVVANTDTYNINQTVLLYSGDTSFSLDGSQLTQTSSFTTQQVVPTVNCVIRANALWTVRDGQRIDIENDRDRTIHEGRLQAYPI